MWRMLLTPVWEAPVPMGAAAGPERRDMNVTAPWALRAYTARKVHTGVSGSTSEEAETTEYWETRTQGRTESTDIAMLVILINDLNNLLGDHLCINCYTLLITIKW